MACRTSVVGMRSLTASQQLAAARSDPQTISAGANSALPMWRAVSVVAAPTELPATAADASRTVVTSSGLPSPPEAASSQGKNGQSAAERPYECRGQPGPAHQRPGVARRADGLSRSPLLA